MAKHCTMCGKEFDIWDENEGFVVDYEIGYGSIYDCNHLHMDLCCECFDKMVGFLVSNSIKNPLKESDWL